MPTKKNPKSDTVDAVFKSNGFPERAMAKAMSGLEGDKWLQPGFKVLMKQQQETLSRKILKDEVIHQIGSDPVFDQLAEFFQARALEEAAKIHLAIADEKWNWLGISFCSL